MPAGGTLTCCDLSDEWTRIGIPYWRKAGIRDRIDLRLGPALQTLDGLLASAAADTFDLAFIDADKTHYYAYYQRCLQLVRQGGLILFDNTLWDGAVADPDDRTDDTMALRELNDNLLGDERIDLSLVPIGDGLTLARKR